MKRILFALCISFALGANSADAREDNICMSDEEYYSYSYLFSLSSNVGLIEECAKKSSSARDMARELVSELADENKKQFKLAVQPFLREYGPRGGKILLKELKGFSENTKKMNEINYETCKASYSMFKKLRKENGSYIGAMDWLAKRIVSKGRVGAPSCGE